VVRTYSRRELVSFLPKWGGALALGVLLASQPGEASARTESFAPVRKGRYTDQQGTHYFVEFEPKAWARRWRVEGFGKPSFNGGDTNERAYALIRAFYTPPGTSRDDGSSRAGFRLIASDASPIIPGDLDGNGKVDIFDYNLLLTNFDKQGRNVVGDINRDGTVNMADYDILIGNFGKTFEVQRWDTPTGTIDKSW
jgi:hypothetical protein